MWTLERFLPLTIGEVPVENKYWKNLIMYLHLRITPKMHYLIHTPHLMLE